MAFEHSPAVAAFTVDEFCAAHRICRTRLYALWSQGRGPRFMKNGTRRLITAEAAADWRRDMEAAASPAIRILQQFLKCPAAGDEKSRRPLAAECRDKGLRT